MQAPLTIVRRTPIGAQAQAPAPSPTPAGLSIVKRDGKPVEADFKVETVGDAGGGGLPDWISGAWDFVKGAAATYDPSPMLETIGKALVPPAYDGPLATKTGARESLGLPRETGLANFATQALTAQTEVLNKARESFAKGDHASAVLQFTNWLTPFVGPGVEAGQQEVRDGRVMHGLGTTFGFMSQLLAPKVANKALGRRQVPALVGENPALADGAAQFARDNAIPLDAATATGSKAVANLKAVADNSIPEIVTRRGQTYRAGQEAALERVGGELMGRARPADWTPERAGEHLRTRVEAAVGESRADQGAAYKVLRDLELDPANVRTVIEKPEVRKTTSDGRSVVLEPAVTRDVALATDVAPAKAGVRGWFDQLSTRKEKVGLTGPETKVHQALYRLMELGDIESLSTVDEVLGGFKTAAREAPATGRAEAAALKAVRDLSRQVDEAARKTPGATKALAEGRAATRAKYEALDTVKRLKEEPVGTFKMLMASDDAGLVKLRALAKFTTPADMATLGRAWLQAKIEAVPNVSNGWSAAKRDWNKVGAETRKIVFGKDGSLPRDIDHFLRVAAEIEKNPNPSGSALTLVSAGQLGALLQFTDPLTSAKIVLGADALSRMMYSPTAVRLLTRGLTTPAGNTVATAAIVAEIAATSERLGVRLTPAPAAAEERGRRR